MATENAEIDLRPRDLLLPLAMVATFCYAMWMVTLGLVAYSLL